MSYKMEKSKEEIWQLFQLCCKVIPNKVQYPTFHSKGSYIQIKEPYTLKCKQKLGYDFIYLITGGKSYMVSFAESRNLDCYIFRQFFECKETILERIRRAEIECRENKDIKHEITDKCVKLNSETIKRYEKKILNY